jgi:hypothetical protein
MVWSVALTVNGQRLFTWSRKHMAMVDCEGISVAWSWRQEPVFYSLPNMLDIANVAADCKNLSKIDLSKGHHPISCIWPTSARRHDYLLRPVREHQDAIWHLKCWQHIPEEDWLGEDLALVLFCLPRKSGGGEQGREGTQTVALMNNIGTASRESN